jgi:hypothetical protein
MMRTRRKQVREEVGSNGGMLSKLEATVKSWARPGAKADV